MRGLCQEQPGEPQGKEAGYSQDQNQGDAVKTIPELLADARDLVKIGWVREVNHREVNGVPCYCAYGAILEAVSSAVTKGMVTNVVSTIDTMGDFCNQVVRGYPHLLPSQGYISWNDYYAKDGDDVVQMFNEAIELAKAS